MGRKIGYWIGRIQAHLMRRFAPKTLAVDPSRAVISFTFDDVPDSALYCAAAILEKYGLRGTFYISGSLVGTSERSRKLISEQGVTELAERGHEIGCHTFSHRNVAKLNGTQLQQETQNNRAFLKRLFGSNWRKDHEKLNFAYPYNSVSYPAWRRLARNYRSCRGGENRINHGATSPQMLCGMEICQPEERSLALTTVIDQVKQQNGWLIFFTHDISETPTPYGCTPSTFEILVRHAVESGCAIMTVDEAMNSYAAAA